MPDPQQIMVDPHTGARAQWDGGQWIHLNNPNPNPGGSGRTNADDLSVFKDFLTGAGSLLPMALAPEVGIPARVAMAMLGGAGGRSVGHGMAATANAAQPSFGEDMMTGAEAGAGQELMPTAIGQGLKYGGKLMQRIGAKLPANDYIRSMIGGVLGGGSLESHGAGAVGGYLSKPVLEQGGALAESAGTKIGPKTTSQRLQGAIDSLTREPEPGPPTHTDINAAARDKVAQKKAAQSTYQNAGYSTPEGGPDMSVPFNIHAHVPAEDSWPGMGPSATRAASPSPDSIMFTQPPPAPAYNGPIGKLTGQKSPTVNSALEDALNGLREQPSVREGTPDASWGPGGTKGWTGSRYEPASNPNLRPPIDPEAQALRDQTAPQPGSPAAASNMRPPLEEGMAMPFTDWASQIDDIINGATEADMPQRKTGFLANSKATKADRAGLDMLRRVNGAAAGIK